MKKVLSLMLALLLTLSLTAPAMAASGLIKYVKYEGNSKVEVEFRNRVQYKGVKVTVKDATGKSYSARIIDKDNDDLEFRVSNIQPDKTYTFTISGIRKRGTKTYKKINGKFTVYSGSRYHYDDDD